MEKTTSPAEGATSGAGAGTTDKRETSATAPANQPKYLRVTGGFVDRGARGWNHFEAARELRDWCLNTTVSQLEKRGLKILRRDETVPGHFGPVRCSRYWLAPESFDRARELLGSPRAKAPADAT